MRVLWRFSRRFAGRASTVAAPAAMAAVIGAWASLAIVGWALVYLPHLPSGFVYADGIPRRGDLAEAMYISMVSLSTVGYGEIVPGEPLLRLVVGAEAVSGFALLTAAVSWILQTYPAFSRRRALAHELDLLRHGTGQEGMSALKPGHGAALLESVARSMAVVTTDLLAFNETYYFHEARQRGSLPANVAYAHILATEAQENGNPDLRFAGRMPQAALDDLAEVLRGKFGHPGQTSTEVFESYETHHRHRRDPGKTTN